MAVRMEPPRPRPAGLDPARYPGLTPEERGLDSPAELAPPEVAPPLWVAPSQVPPAARSTGFVALPPRSPEPVPAPETEGLFDVPGLLERLWLARALEASHRARVVAAGTPADAPPRAPSSTVPDGAPVSRSGGVAVVLRPAPVPVLRLRPPPGPGPTVPVATPRPPAEPTQPPAALRRPSSWICPYCYLANDPAATTCRGCRSGSLHL